VIRNAIAHRSGRAQTKFRKMTGSHFVTPGAFLVSVANGTSTCEAHLNAFVRVIHGLCANTHHEVEMLLGPNDPFKSGQKPGAGAFTCRGCGRTYVLTQGDPLVCPACDPPCASCGRPMSAAAVFDD
jgi:hypothetical protein